MQYILAKIRINILFYNKMRFFDSILPWLRSPVAQNDVLARLVEVVAVG